MATFKQLKTFITVAEYKKMSAAAKKLYISQPTVSQIISDLEKEYDEIFFQRLPRELKLTPSGKIFLSKARDVVASYDNLEQSMKRINSIRLLKVGATLTIGSTIMAPLIGKLNRNYPDIETTVCIDNTEKIENMLLHGELDIALVEGIIIREEIQTLPIIEDNLQLFCSNSHPFAYKASVSIEELRNENFIMREKGSGTRSIFDNIMLTHHIPYNIKWESSSSVAIIDAVCHNLGLGILSERCLTQHIENKQIHLCNIDDVSMNRYFYICYNQEHRITSQMQDFIEITKISKADLSLAAL